MYSRPFDFFKSLTRLPGELRGQLGIIQKAEDTCLNRTTILHFSLVCKTSTISLVSQARLSHESLARETTIILNSVYHELTKHHAVIPALQTSG